MKWVMKLQRHGGQFRVTLPRELIVKAGFEDVEVIRLEMIVKGRIMIDEYYGKGKEERDIQEDKS